MKAYWMLIWPFRLGLPTEPLQKPLEASAADGWLLGRVTDPTQLVSLLISGNQYNSISFHSLNTAQVPVVLGCPWLQTHNPHIDWTNGTITGWSLFCHSNCLQTAVLRVSAPDLVLPPDLPLMPPECHDFGKVFNKTQAISLPSYIPYDCPIDLLPGATPPRCRLHPLSSPPKKGWSWKNT